MIKKTDFKSAFTLIELLISISILSIMMIYLYKSYASLNISNNFYKEKVTSMIDIKMKKKVIYLDFSLSLFNSIKIINQEKNKDIVFMQTNNSIHNKDNPFVAYIMKEEKLYRLESLKPFTKYPLSVDTQFVADYIGEVKAFRVYKSDNKDTPDTYLVHIDFKKQEDLLYKIKVLNQY